MEGEDLRMGKAFAPTKWPVAVVLSLLLAACGGPMGGPKLQDAGIGLTMDLPPQLARGSDGP